MVEVTGMDPSNSWRITLACPLPYRLLPESGGPHGSRRSRRSCAGSGSTTVKARRDCPELARRLRCSAKVFGGNNRDQTDLLAAVQAGMAGSNPAKAAKNPTVSQAADHGYPIREHI